ncbi:MAG: hypothetical protein JWP69_429 [Flaviaesturariibacter sp.]|nr:hypothetical protein [Flaviaesturariibacter sp.]
MGRLVIYFTVYNTAFSSRTVYRTLYVSLVARCEIRANRLILLKNNRRNCWDFLF